VRAFALGSISTSALGLGVAALALAACGSPGAPGDILDARRPPRPAAQSCPPVPVARIVDTVNGKTSSDYTFVDLEGDSDCVVKLEQDECVVAIFADCTSAVIRAPGIPRVRQWSGTIRDARGYQLELFPSFVSTPPPPSISRCVGPLEGTDDGDVHARLTCLDAAGLEVEDHRGLFLEKSRKVPAFARLAAQATLSFEPDVARGVQWYSTARWTSVAARGELWTTIPSTDGAGGGIYAMALDGAIAAPRRVLERDAVERVAVSDTRAFLSRNTRNGETVVEAYDLATLTRVAEARFEATVTALAVGREDDVYVGLLMGQSGQASRIARLRASTLASMGDAAVVGAQNEPIEPRDIVVTGTAAIGASVFVVGSGSGDTSRPDNGRRPGALVGYTRGLQSIARRSISSFTGRRVIPIVPAGQSEPTHLGLVGWMSRRYQELRLADGELMPAIALPEMRRLISGTYDAERDRVYLVGESAELTYVDRARARAHAPFRFEGDPGLGQQVIRNLGDIYLRADRKLLLVDSSGTSRVVVVEEP
jgi:hypothetical protein